VGNLDPLAMSSQFRSDGAVEFETPLVDSLVSAKCYESRILDIL